MKQDRKSFVSAIADFLTWALALVSVGAAWWQTARLFALFGDPSAPWWAYIAASSVEGAIVVCGLLLMEERESAVAAGAFLVFVANVSVSVLAQIGEAAITAGYEAPSWMSLVVRMVAPAMVTLVGAALWGLKIARARGEMASAQVSREAAPASSAQVSREEAPVSREAAQVPGVPVVDASDNGARPKASAKTKGG